MAQTEVKHARQVTLEMLIRASCDTAAEILRDERPPEDLRRQSRSDDMQESAMAPESRLHRKTVGSEKACGTKGVVAAIREKRVTLHLPKTINRNGGSTIGGCTTRHVGCEVSQRNRRCMEQRFGSGKVSGPVRQVMVHGLEKVDALLTLMMAAYNLTRLLGSEPLRPMSAKNTQMSPSNRPGNCEKCLSCCHGWAE